jgi:hypothetical protein
MRLQELGQLITRVLRARLGFDAHVRGHELGTEDEAQSPRLQDAERVLQAAASERVGA